MHRLLSLTVLVLLAISLVSCGATAPTETVTVTNSSGQSRERTPGPEPKRERTASPGRATGGPAAAATTVARTHCDQNITAKVGSTSCAFALNVFWAYWHAREAGTTSVSAYSPATHETYDLTCSSGVLVTCHAGDGAEVQFPVAAIQAYDAAMADRYAATHDTGPTVGTQDERKPSEPDDTCDPAYEGQCLDPDAYDYDCKDGGGDGPKYTGLVRVVGDDHYELDRDGDGVACEPY